MYAINLTHIQPLLLRSGVQVRPGPSHAHRQAEAEPGKTICVQRGSLPLSQAVVQLAKGTDVSRSASSETSPCCNLSLLLLQACEILIQTNGGACQLGSGLELVYTVCLSVFSSKCTSTLPSAASFLACNRLALTHVFIFSDSKASATLKLSAESPPGYSKFLKMAFSHPVPA